jgi:hypothetical protein
MQPDKHFTDKLRQLDAQDAPNLNQIDQHWQQMQQMLAPPAAPVINAPQRWLLNGLGIGLLLGIITIAYLLLIQNNTPTNTPIASATLNAKDSTVQKAESPEATDSSTIIQNTVAISRQLHTLLPIPTTSIESETDDLLSNMKIRFTDCDSCLAKNNIDTASAAGAVTQPLSDAQLLSNFFAAIVPSALVFEINTARDSLLVTPAGTELRYTAHSFITANGRPAQGMAKLEVKEFYDYASILTHQLSTSSNGAQLESGGMLKIDASQKNDPLQLAAGKTIGVSMPTDRFDPRMQLFTPAEPVFVNRLMTGDTTSPSAAPINWQPNGQFQNIELPKLMIKTFDPYGQPYRLIENTRTGMITGKFMIKRNCSMSNKEVEAALKARLGMIYDRIKVKRSWSNHPKPLFSKIEWPVVGDSAEIDYQIAKKLNILTKKQVEEYEAQLLKDSNQLRDSYSKMKFYHFQIAKMGFINCDRFYNSTLPKTDYTVAPEENKKIVPSYTVLAFSKFRSVLYGYNRNEGTVFTNIPIGEPVYLVSLEVKDGMICSAISTDNISENGMHLLQYQPTTPEAFVKKLKELRIYQDY